MRFSLMRCHKIIQQRLIIDGKELTLISLKNNISDSNPYISYVKENSKSKKERGEKTRSFLPTIGLKGTGKTTVIHQKKYSL